MHYYNSMQALVGHTPLVKLNHLGVPEGVNLFGKLEYYNPTGSVKDRTGRHMVEAAEAKGTLKPGGTIVLSTAGNTGLGVAFAALNKGYRVVFAVPEKFSYEKQILMHALGAEIVHTRRAEGMLGANKRALELSHIIQDAVLMDQFSDLSNPQAHFESTGPEIYMDLDGNLDYFVAGAGSGGTFTGIVRFLKAHIPHLKAVLADPVGSTLGGGSHADYNIEGIGNDFVADTFDISLVDQAIKVSDDEAFDGSKKLARFEGIFAGSSSGAALSAALKLIDQGARGNIVFILPDRGDRYFSKNLYDQVD